MAILALSGVLSLGRWWIFIGGAVWILCAAGLAVADLYAYRRRVTTTARCIAVREEPKGTVRHTLERIPVGDEKKLVALRTKGVSCAVDASLKISYDPKRAHEVFVASRHPRMARWQSEAVVAVIGVALMLYVLIRWGLS